MRFALLVALSTVNVWFLLTWWRTERSSSATPSILRRAPTPTEYLIGFVTNFFDTLGIGSFAPTTAAFKLKRLVPDECIPGTLNIGHTPPTVLEAFIFIVAVQVDPLLLVSTIAAAVAGAWFGAGLLVRLDRRTLQFIVGTALICGAIGFTLTNLQLLPAGGTETALHGWRFAVAVAVHAVLGALMTAGIGLFAPSIITLSLLGMHPLMAFPIMMGSCSFLQPVASQRFLASGKYALGPALALSIAGLAGVCIAAFVVKSMPLTTLRWLVVAVVLYAATLTLRAAFTSSRTASPAPTASA